MRLTYNFLAQIYDIIINHLDINANKNYFVLCDNYILFNYTNKYNN